ncbi:hypothetical protein ACHAXR_008961 [Thalassiosira sp. AJA248-18]
MKTGFLPSRYRLILVIIAAALFPGPLVVAVGEKHGKGDDLYVLLGVPRTASIKEIKSAYRRKARDTHPDKNKNVSAEEAAAEFHKVVHAFEVLSDTSSRRRYDVGGDDSTSGNTGGRGSASSFHWQFFQQRRTVHLKDKFEVKQAQSRVLHVVSLEQLRTIMLDDNERLERHLLLCFFTPSLETLVNDEIVYPWPFAGMSNQHVWWEDLLQTASIRFHRSNELTRYFNIGSGEDMTEPVFVFSKRGAMLGESIGHDGGTNFATYATRDRESFETWMWSMIEAKVVFHNNHHAPVELYWITGNRANIKQVIAPNTSSIHYSMITHEFYARALATGRFGVEGKGGSPPIGEDGSVLINIPLKDCLDLSGHCQFWANQNQCNENPSFMKDKCMLTCGHCSNVQEDQTCENGLNDACRT